LAKARAPALTWSGQIGSFGKQIAGLQHGRLAGPELLGEVVQGVR
jgi:hypothetical protein